MNTLYVSITDAKGNKINENDFEMNIKFRLMIKENFPGFKIKTLTPEVKSALSEILRIDDEIVKLFEKRPSNPSVAERSEHEKKVFWLNAEKDQNLKTLVSYLQMPIPQAEADAKIVYEPFTDIFVNDDPILNNNCKSHYIDDERRVYGNRILKFTYKKTKVKK